jgi:hypothetical protein
VVQPSANVTTARICRLSGKLATDACHESGPDARSTAYYENFVSGTEPTESCPFHNPSSRGRSAR